MLRYYVDKYGAWLAGMLLLLCSCFAHATNYYVDCRTGSNGNPGTFDQPWRTPLEIGIYSANPGFLPGDAIYLHRDCTWNDGIVFTSSGSAGNLITIDSYGGYNSAPFSSGPGTGTPPHLTGYLPVPAANWTRYSGNVWVSAPLYRSGICSTGSPCVACPTVQFSYSCLDQPLNVLNFVRFGTVWGNDQEAAVSASSIAGGLLKDRDWYFDTSTTDSTAQSLFIYCTCSGSTNPQTYYGAVVPIAVGNEDSPSNGGVPMVNLNGVQYVQAQHLLVDWNDSIGVLVQGASNHIWLANIAANSYVENGLYRNNVTRALCPVSLTGCSQYTQIGFWIDPTGTPTDIHLYNVDANMNYSGFKFGTSTGSPGQQYELKNCRAYANRTYALIDDSNGGLSHDYCHFYANNLATATETDFSTDCTTTSCSGGTPYVAPTCGADDVPGANCNKLSQVYVLQGPGDQTQFNWSGVQTYLYNNPVVAGGTIQIWWSDFDTGSGYNFAYIDSLVSAWTAVGKKANLVLQHVQSSVSSSACTVYNSINSGTGSVGNCATPGYVWSAIGSANYSGCGLGNTQRIPNYFNSTWQTDYKAAAAALVNHYAGNPFVGYIRVAMGRGGEMLPDPQWSSTCLSQLETWSSTGSQSAFVSAWETYLSGFAAWEGGANFNGAHSPIQLMGAITPMGTPSTQVPDYIAPILKTNNVGFGSQGLEASDVNNCSGSTADWCNLFAANSGVPHELQTFYYSCPLLASGCNGNQTTTGPLPPLLAFAAANGASILEIYWEDWLIAFDSAYRTGQGYSTLNGTQYAAALTELPFPAATPPAIEQWKRWPAYVSLTYDDPGLVQYSDEYVNQILPLVTSKLGNSNFSIAVVTGSDYSQAIISRVQGWITSGFDIVTHSVSHEYWDPPATGCGDDPSSANYNVTSTTVPCHALVNLQYTGSIASTVSLTITHSGTGGTLTLNPSPYDACAYHSWDLTPVPPGGTVTGSEINTLGTVVATLAGSACYTVTLDSLAKGDAHAYGLADVSLSDVKAAPVKLDFAENYLENDEIGWAFSWFGHYLTGLPTNRLYVMPSSFEDTRTETYASQIGYRGVRGSVSLRPCCAANTTLGNGFNVLNIPSYGINPTLQNLTYTQMRMFMQADAFKNALWGRPMGFFWHINELPYDQVENMLDALNQGGATVMSDTKLMNLLLACNQNDTVPPANNANGDQSTPYVPGTFYTCPSTGAEADFRQTLNSPTLDAGTNLGSAYQYDLAGNNRTGAGTGWDIGAREYLPLSMPGFKHP